MHPRRRAHANPRTRAAAPNYRANLGGTLACARWSKMEQSSPFSHFYISSGTAYNPEERTAWPCLFMLYPSIRLSRVVLATIVSGARYRPGSSQERTG